MEENEVYYVILNMNCQYEICRKCPKSGIFKGTHEECEAFIDGTRCSNEPNAEFCYVVEPIDTTKDSFSDWSVQTDKAILYRGSKSKCEAFKKGIEYELKGKTSMEEKSNNLKYENDEPPASPSSIKMSNFETWFPYHSQEEELKNNLKSVIASNIGIDETVNIVIALCRQIMIQVPTENSPYVLTVQNPYNQPKVWYNYRGDQINPNDVLCNSKPNPYMPYEYCSTQLKSDTENNDLVHVPVGGTISAELYNIIKDKLEHGIEYHECDGTRIDKKEYETLYNAIGHTYDDFGDNVEISDFRLPNMNGWYIRIK